MQVPHLNSWSAKAVSLLISCLALAAALMVLSPTAALAGSSPGYQFDSAWPSLPQAGTGNGKFNNPTAVDLNATGDVYVVDSLNNRIQKFDSSGNFLTKWGSKGTGNGQFNNPRDLAINSKGEVFVADSGNHRIQRFGPSGNFLSVIGGAGSGNGKFKSPLGIAVNAKDQIYVADTGNYRVQRFGPSGNFISKWGTFGTGESQFTRPDGITVHQSGWVFVTDSSARRIQMFWNFGGYANTFTGPTKSSVPIAVVTDSFRNTYISYGDSNSIVKKEHGGAFLHQFGTAGSGNGKFNSATGLALDSSGNLYVADSKNHRIQRFERITPKVSLWPRFLVSSPFTNKLAGTVKDQSGRPFINARVIIQYSDGGSWTWLATTHTDTNGYFQSWLRYALDGRIYRAKHDFSGTYSNQASPKVIAGISASNNYRPKTRYCQWTNLQGRYMGPDYDSGANTKIYLQRWTGSKWVWQASVMTDSSGNYTAWAPVCMSTTFRMATAGSAVTSNTVRKIGSTIAAWENERVHGVLRDGYGDPVSGIWLYLQRWDGTKWVWQASCETSSTGYCHFRSANPSGQLRIATWGAKVVSRDF